MRRHPGDSRVVLPALAVLEKIQSIGFMNVDVVNPLKDD